MSRWAENDLYDSSLSEKIYRAIAVFDSLIIKLIVKLIV